MEATVLKISKVPYAASAESSVSTRFATSGTTRPSPGSDLELISPMTRTADDMLLHEAARSSCIRSIAGDVQVNANQVVNKSKTSR
jgi:hypothetical protein